MLTFDGTTLIAANAAILRRWVLADGVLHAVALTDRLSGRDWILSAPQASMVPPGGAGSGPWQADFVRMTGNPPWEEPAERATLTVIAADGRGSRLHIVVPV